MKLLELHIKNFKGLNDFSFCPMGQDISIFGDNATGKTTLMDAVSWLLTGKDSNGRADFQIKPVDELGQEIHNLEVSVYAIFDNITLKKVYKEKWTQKRGQASTEMTGHTTDHYIDDVPEKKGVFTAKIKELFDEKVFSLLTNPLAFNSEHWEKRRQILIDICGDVSNDDVVNSDPDLSKLADIIGKSSIEDHQKKIKAKKQEINRELKEIPARIDELKNSLAHVAKPELAAKAAFLKKLDAAIKMKHDLSSPVAAAEKRARIAEINAEISKLKAEAVGAVAEKKKPLQVKIDVLDGERRAITGKIDRMADQIEKENQRNGITIKSMDTLRAEFKRENEKTFSIDSTCPTCGQDLPEDQIETAKANFNQQKAAKLEDINRRGKEMKAETEKRAADIEISQKTVDDLNGQLKDLDTQLNRLNYELDEITEDYIEPAGLLEEKTKLQDEVKALESGNQDEANKVQADIDHFKSEITRIEQQQATYDAAQKTEARVIELEDQEKFLAKQFESLEHDLYIIEKFIIAKVDLLEEKINSKFKMAQFKLFDTQINGGINEVCETLYNGVPFNSGLNNAARINVGLDIINTLSDHYNFHPPIFIDNAESVIDIIDTKAQQIRLVVDGDYDQLTWNPETATETGEAA